MNASTIRSLQAGPSTGSGKSLYKHLLLVFLSLVPLGASTVVALVAWEAFQVLAPASRLAVVVLSWIVAFAAATRAFWKAVEIVTPW